MKLLIKELLRETLMSEEYSNGLLIGYHVTSFENWEAIKNKGLNVGNRAMQGKGLYGFYDYNHAIRYANKGETNNPIIVKFEVIKPERFLILNMEIAQEVLGPNDYHLMNQIENYFYGGLETLYNDYVKLANPNMSIETLKEKIAKIETDNSEMSQRTFVFSLIPSSLNDKLNIIWDGNYGLEYRINRLDLIKVIGYKQLSDNSEVSIPILDKIPNNEEFSSLIEFIKAYPNLDTIGKAYKFANDKYNSVRNIKEWEFYEKIIDLLEKLK
jgi:hypothetical protein